MCCASRQAVRRRVDRLSVAKPIRPRVAVTGSGTVRVTWPRISPVGWPGTGLGGHEATLSGLAGIGDLVLTCTGDLSRNRQVGLAVGRGERLADVLAGMQQVAEGVLTTKAARDLAREHDVEMPIVDAAFAILFEEVPPQRVLAELMARAPKPERWS